MRIETGKRKAAFSGIRALIPQTNRNVLQQCSRSYGAQREKDQEQEAWKKGRGNGARPRLNRSSNTPKTRYEKKVETRSLQYKSRWFIWHPLAAFEIEVIFSEWKLISVAGQHMLKTGRLCTTALLIVATVSSALRRILRPFPRLLIRKQIDSVRIHKLWHLLHAGQELLFKPFV